MKWKLLLAAGVGSAAILWTQTTFNTMVLTSQGQILNARLGDNIYLDTAPSPPMLRAKRPILHIRPTEQTDNTWIIPSNVSMAVGYQMIVVLNGLEATEGVDYKIDPANPRHILPFADKDPAVKQVWHFPAYVDPAGVAHPEEPYLVKVHIYP